MPLKMTENKMRLSSDCEKWMWNKAKLNSAVKYWSQREQSYRSETYTISKGVLSNEWGWKFKQLLRGLNLEFSGRISLRFQQF